MSRTFKLNRVCETCKCPIDDKNKTGFCNKHRPRSGKNNPMYGRSIKDCMTVEKQQKWRDNLSKAAKKSWEDPLYRDKVVSANTGKTRSDEFKVAQSIRTKQTYIDNPELRKIRGKLFKECWEDGRNHWSAKESTNRSKGEIELFNELQNYQWLSVSRKTIHAVDGKYYYPDILINDTIIVEFYGDYYHANPKYYSDGDFISKKNITAKQVREIDAQRQFALEQAGYKFLVVWQSEWKENKAKVIKQLLSNFK